MPYVGLQTFDKGLQLLKKAYTPYHFIPSGYRPSASLQPSSSHLCHRLPPSPLAPMQHHTTPRRAPHDALLVTPQGGLHRLVALGPRQLLLLPDQRGERTRWVDKVWGSWRSACCRVRHVGRFRPQERGGRQPARYNRNPKEAYRLPPGVRPRNTPPRPPPPRYQVLPLESYAELFALLARPPPTLRHLVVVCTVPLVYPHIIGSHK